MFKKFSISVFSLDFVVLNKMTICLKNCLSLDIQIFRQINAATWTATYLMALFSFYKARDSSEVLIMVCFQAVNHKTDLKTNFCNANIAMTSLV